MIPIAGMSYKTNKPAKPMTHPPDEVRWPISAFLPSRTRVTSANQLTHNFLLCVGQSLVSLGSCIEKSFRVSPEYVFISPGRARQNWASHFDEKHRDSNQVHVRHPLTKIGNGLIYFFFTKESLGCGRTLNKVRR